MASQVASITHFEIYVLAQKRWTLQLRFRQDQKDEALEEARTIERTLNLPVKVMRETYFPATNSCEEVAVYISARTAPQEPAPGLGIEAAARARSAGGPGPAARAPSIFDSESTGSLVLMLLVIVVVALAVAATSTEALDLVLKEVGRSGTPIAEATRTRLLFGTFAISFLGVAIPTTVWFIAGAEKRARERAKSTTKAYGRSEPVSTLSREEQALGRAARSMIWDMLKAPFQPMPPAVASAPRTASMVEPQPASPITALESGPDFTASEAKVEGAPQSEIPADPEASSTDASPQAVAAEPIEKTRMTAMRFLGETVSQLKSISPQLDAYSRFGVNLMLAGALEKLAHRTGTDDATRLALVREAIAMLGIKASLAETFCDKLDEYLLETRYLQMVQAGRAFMDAFLAGESDPLKNLGEMLDGWNKPGARAQAPRIVTVLFTDIVGSTDLTQSQGDIAAQNLVRRHNGIVRNALAEFDGREVKHTGDGIMASFGSTSNAVDAAIAIQRAVVEYSATAANLPLRLRIGINAGEPIEEEDDLFGTTVQLAARLCAAAQPEQILCSNVVRELSAGKGRHFADKGEQDLKGFPQPVPLYEVIWQDVPVELAAADFPTRRA